MATDTSSVNSTYDFASMAALKKGATGSLSESSMGVADFITEAIEFRGQTDGEKS